MAKTNKDRLIETFVARNRRAGTSGLRTTTPRVTQGGYQPPKLGTGARMRALPRAKVSADTAVYKPIKRGRRAAY